MRTNHHFGSWSRLVTVMALVAVTASSATAADTLERRLENAGRLLARHASALSTAQMDALSTTLGEALGTAHYGLQTSALRLLIEYADVVTFDRETVFDVVRLYRNHENDRVRRMAVVALDSLNDAWGNDFLHRSLRFEKNAAVKHTITAVLVRA